MFYTLIKHGFLTNQSACSAIYILKLNHTCKYNSLKCDWCINCCIAKCGESKKSLQKKGGQLKSAKVFLLCVYKVILKVFNFKGFV